jgi:hypothetical protein
MTRGIVIRESPVRTGIEALYTIKATANEPAFFGILSYSLKNLMIFYV